MTTRVVLAHRRERVAEVRERLAADTDDRPDLDAVVVVDDAGRLLDDLRLIELLLAGPDDRFEQLVSDAGPVTVNSDAPLEDVVDRLIESRRTSLVVIDDDHHPIGRILADDVIDALVPTRGRRRVHVRLP